MSRNLYLLRHAKSSWDDPELADHDRPLAPRGERACRTIATYLRSQAIAPELVLCSSARRTQETLERISAHLGGEWGVRTEIERSLYATSAEELLERLRQVPEEVGSVLLVNHQPAIQELGLELAGSGEDLERLRGKFPTAALATLTFPGPWLELGLGEARLEAFVKPRELGQS